MASATYHLQLQDSVIVPQPSDTIVLTGESQNEIQVNTEDSAIGYFPSISADLKISRSLAKPITPENEGNNIQMVTSPVKTIQEWNTGENFLIENGLTGIVAGISNKHHQTNAAASAGTLQPPEIAPQQRKISTHDWLFGIFLLLVVLFVWIRIFYSKFFTMLASALVSFHVSAKLFHEKNVLLQRVSIVLDFIYLIVISVFLFEFITYKGLSGFSITGIKLYLILFNIVILYSLFRNIILKFSGFLFLSRTLFGEYLHNIFVVNKGMGIVLFPIVIMVHYLPYKLVPALLILGICVFILAFVWKSIRAYQIIIHRDVLLFYLILYLCTLEILPLLLGYKFVTTLI